jgi:hypothetical protein
MATSLDEFRSEISRIWPLLRTIKWGDPTFTPEKAYVTAVFSKIAYLHIPSFEVRYHPLAKIIPCLTYRELLALGTSLDARAFLRSLEFADQFVVERTHVVAVGVCTSKVIFVALRGTRPLYISDWMIDFKLTRTATHVDYNGHHSVAFHSGFYLTITDCLDQIASEIQKRISYGATPTPVYVVGHSLGGAMAAIAHALSQTTFYSHYNYGLKMMAMINTHSCFTFGMPRYGDSEATYNLRSPFHTYNDGDLIPGLPPRGLGFENAPLEYRAVEDGPVNMMPQDRQGFGWWLSRMPLRGASNHLIESYITRLRKAAGTS